LFPKRIYLMKQIKFQKPGLFDATASKIT